jgi:hypothetical protein
MAITVWALEGDAPGRMIVRQRIQVDESGASRLRTPELDSCNVLFVTTLVEAGDFGIQAIQDSEKLDVGTAQWW